MKRISVALTVGFSFVAAQGCMAEPMDESEIGSADQAVCESLTYSKVMAALLVALAEETGELHPTKHLVKQTSKFGNGIDGVNLSSAATTACAARGKTGCPNTQMLLDLQTPGVNPALDPAVLNTEDYRGNLVAKLQDQINYENSRTQNGQCLPPAHTLSLMGISAAQCGKDYQYGVSFGSSSFEVTREAESYNAYNRNNSQHNWSLSSGAMTIGPDWAHQWTSYSTAPNLSYAISFPAAGNYKVWVRGKGPNANGDSVYVGINNTSNGAMVGFPTANNAYGWAAGDISVPSAGTHNVMLYAREDGASVDKIVVNQSSTAPSGAVAGCNTPADLVQRIDRFQVNSSGYVGFSADATSIHLDPDDTTNPGGGSGTGSGSSTCAATPPPGGSDTLMMPYAGNEQRENTCCWQSYVQKTYKRHLTKYLMCKT